MNTEKFKDLAGIEENTEIGITPAGEKVSYGMFLKNPYILRNFMRLNPAQVNRVFVVMQQFKQVIL